MNGRLEWSDMCGIAAILWRQDSRHQDVMDTVGRLRRMEQALAHRGPDDHGYLQWSRDGELQIGRDLASRSSDLVLIHRRLSILDPSNASWQPMSSPDGRYHLVFNGEIYNYLEIRQELEAIGYTFHSSGDTEVLLAALSTWGTEAIRRLIGMFAFTLFDAKERRLLVARDHFGIKPLYYANWLGGLAFASEARALLELPGISRNINPSRLFQYLRFGVTDHGSETLLEGIRQLPAAHYAVIDVDGSLNVTGDRYWDCRASDRLDISMSEAAPRLRELFLDSIRLHLRSDVPVGMCLSGGIDSSAIACAVRHVTGSHADLRAFTYVADDEATNEQQYARQVGEKVNATVTYVRASPNELIRELDQLIDAQDNPFGSTSIYAQRRVFQVASEEGIKVLLDGQGADEMLGGYEYFTACRAASLLGQGRLRDGYRLLCALRGRKRTGQTPPIWLHAAGLLLPEALREFAARISGNHPMPHWMNADWFNQHDVHGTIPRQAAGPDYLREQLWISMTETSLPAILRYEDRNSMTWSTESRVPFLTPSLVEFTLSLPEDLLIAGDGTSKAVFREAMRGLVPDPILDRKDKIGFATPEAAWLRQVHPWVRTILAGDLATEIPALKSDIMQRQWQAFLDGRARYDSRIWRWINLLRWAELRDVRFS